MFCDVFPDRFSDDISIPFKVEYIISYLKSSPEKDSEPPKLLDHMRISCTCKIGSYEKWCGKKFSCFLIMKTDNLFLIYMHMVFSDISYLSSHHTHITDSSRNFEYCLWIFRFCKTLYPHRLECIPYENTNSFSIFFPYGQLSSSKLIIIHRWKIIMDKRVCMDKLDTDKITQNHIRRKAHKFLIDDHRKDDSYSFSFSFHCVSESFLKFPFFFCDKGIIAFIKILRYRRVNFWPICIVPVLDHRNEWLHHSTIRLREMQLLIIKTESIFKIFFRDFHTYQWSLQYLLQRSLASSFEKIHTLHMESEKGEIPSDVYVILFWW